MIKSPIEVINDYIEEDLAHFKEPNLTDHHEKRLERSNSASSRRSAYEIPRDMTKEQYDEKADELTKQPALPISSERESRVQGYITQEGRKIKFQQDSEHPNVYWYAVYAGDDITGTVVTCFKTDWDYILRAANPLGPKKSRDSRYFSDLDGDTKGIEIFCVPEGDIKDKLMKKEKLQ